MTRRVRLKSSSPDDKGQERVWKLRPRLKRRCTLPDQNKCLLNLAKGQIWSFFCRALTWLEMTGSVVLTWDFLLSILNHKKKRKISRRAFALLHRHMHKFLFHHHLTGSHWERWGGQAEQAGLCIQTPKTHTRPWTGISLWSLFTSLTVLPFCPLPLHAAWCLDTQGSACGYIHWSCSGWTIPSVTAAASQSKQTRDKADGAEACLKWKRMWDENEQMREKCLSELSPSAPLWHCGDDRNRPLLSPGSRSHPSAWSHVCLWGGREKKRVCLEGSNMLTMADFFYFDSFGLKQPRPVTSLSPRILTGRTWDMAIKTKKRRRRKKKIKLWSWPIYGLWWWMEKDKHSTFPLFFNQWGSHCIFTLDCILTLLWYIIAVCFISRCRTAVRNRWGTQHPSSTSRHKHSTSQLKSSR